MDRCFAATVNLGVTLPYEVTDREWVLSACLDRPGVLYLDAELAAVLVVLGLPRSLLSACDHAGEGQVTKALEGLAAPWSLWCNELSSADLSQNSSVRIPLLSSSDSVSVLWTSCVSRSQCSQRETGHWVLLTWEKAWSKNVRKLDASLQQQRPCQEIQPAAKERQAQYWRRNATSAMDTTLDVYTAGGGGVGINATFVSRIHLWQPTVIPNIKTKTLNSNPHKCIHGSSSNKDVAIIKMIHLGWSFPRFSLPLHWKSSIYCKGEIWLFLPLGLGVHPRGGKRNGPQPSAAFEKIQRMQFVVGSSFTPQLQHQWAPV